MVQVSQKFMELAQQSGRYVFCKIIADGVVFLDDRILEFDFDDVAYPDWLTIGTACSNRFAFSLRFGGQIALNAEVRPYISFDGEEWCPLGVFYASRRYVRGNYVSIICYDRFYSLDKEYSCGLSLPSTTDALLREICSEYDISCADYGFPYNVETVPEDCTVRDVIGWIAAMNHACARFDRGGALCFKTFSGAEDFFLQVSNCMEYTRSMSLSYIKRVVADTGAETLESGSGSMLSTIEIYNPFMTQKRLDDLILQLSPLCFYAADIEMQGMPFLEAGDFIRLEESPAVFYPIAVSEIEYHYDGGLTARLSSRCRTAQNSGGDGDGASCGCLYSYIKQTNGEDITVGTEEITAADFEFKTKFADTFAQADVNFTLEGTGSETLEVSVYVNGEKARTSVHAASGEEELIHFYHLADKLPRGKNHITVTFRASGGNMTIRAGRFIATLVWKGTAGGGGEFRDRLILYDKSGLIPLIPEPPGLTSLSGGFETALE